MALMLIHATANGKLKTFNGLVIHAILKKTVNGLSLAVNMQIVFPGMHSFFSAYHVGFDVRVRADRKMPKHKCWPVA